MRRFLYNFSIFGWLIVFSLQTNTCFAFGGGSSDDEPVPSATATPYRYVNFRQLTVPEFYLPHGKRIDMNIDLKEIVTTQINKSRQLRTYAEGSGQDARLVIAGGITTLELDVTEIGFTIGWDPTGGLPIPGSISASSETDLRLSKLSMDFRIFDRETGEVYLAHYTNETLSQLKFDIRVKWNEIGTSFDFAYKTALADAVRAAVSDIIKKMDADEKMAYVPWQAQVTGIDVAQNSLYFSAGGRDGVRAKEQYSIYSYCDETNVNCLQRYLGDVQVSQANQNQAYASILSNGSQMQVGDLVYIKPRRTLD